MQTCSWQMDMSDFGTSNEKNQSMIAFAALMVEAFGNENTQLYSERSSRSIGTFLYPVLLGPK